MKILIAGSSSGIGTELTKNFDKEGNFLYLTYRQNKNNIYKPKNAEYKCLQIDFLDEKIVDANFKYIDNLDVAINVLGNIDNSLIKNMKSSQWNDVINNNLNVIFYATRAEIQKMNQNSHIINISSPTEVEPNWNEGPDRMRPLLVALLGLLLLLQYRLWLGEGGIRERQGLETQARAGEESNQRLRERNDALARQVLELQEGDEMLEAVAREARGVVRQGEEFILFVEDDSEEKSP